MFFSKKDKIWYWLFLLPISLAFITVVIIPFFMGVYYSFTNWNAIPGSTINWIGLDNFSRIITDEQFSKSFVTTIFFTIIVVLSVNIIGFLLALLVTRNLKVKNFLRAGFFMPNLIGGLVLGYVWRFIFLKVFPSIYEASNISFFGWAWLGETNKAILALAIVSTWQYAGYVMVIYVAAIQNIPDQLIEAAKVDGASRLQRLRKITFPLVAPAFTVSLFLTLSYSFKLYNVNVSLTNGDPARGTELLAMNIVNTAFTFGEFAYAQALAIVFLLVIASITLSQVYFTKKREVEM